MKGGAITRRRPWRCTRNYGARSGALSHRLRSGDAPRLLFLHRGRARRTTTPAADARACERLPADLLRPAGRRAIATEDRSPVTWHTTSRSRGTRARALARALHARRLFVGRAARAPQPHCRRGRFPRPGHCTLRGHRKGAGPGALGAHWPGSRHHHASRAQFSEELARRQRAPWIQEERAATSPRRGCASAIPPHLAKRIFELGVAGYFADPGTRARAHPLSRDRARAAVRVGEPRGATISRLSCRSSAHRRSFCTAPTTRFHSPRHS